MDTPRAGLHDPASMPGQSALGHVHPLHRRLLSVLLRASGEVECRISGAYASLRQTQVAAHDVGTLDERNALVIRDPPTQPFATESAVSSNHQPLGRDIL